LGLYSDVSDISKYIAFFQYMLDFLAAQDRWNPGLNF